VDGYEANAKSVGSTNVYRQDPNYGFVQHDFVSSWTSQRGNKTWIFDLYEFILPINLL